MDKFDAVKKVHERILKLEPESVTMKIIGYMYLRDYPDQEIIRLAMGPDTLIYELIHKAKTALKLPSTSCLSPPISPSMNQVPISDPSFRLPSIAPPLARPFPSPASFRVTAPFWEPPVPEQQQQIVYNSEFSHLPFSDSPHDDYGPHKQQQQPQLVPFEESGDFVYPEPGFSVRGRRNSPAVIEFPPKACHYFSKGFCKHGSNCRYLHGHPFPDNYPRGMYGSNAFDNGNDDQVFSPGSLEKLELEITELLKSRRGSPVSIASLPMMYYEKYGRTLQAEGYLTESQRHGKAGYNLTKLLARLKNSIRLIDRPHGQHSVILAEDASKYIEFRGERNDPGPIVSGSRQIYLTFPAESTFTEEDVSNYFNAFGPVQDVRIPCQQKRMFGFVTFASSDTVKTVLHKGNPHFVCGARVLVKPYREKSKPIERKFQDKIDPSMNYSSHNDFESENQSRLDSKFLRRFEEQHALELEIRQLSQLQLARKPLLSNHSFFGHSMDELKMSEEYSKLTSADDFYQLDGPSGGSSSDDNNQIHSGTKYHDHDSNSGINLPDSPFASALPTSISAVM
nr:zinc finger CCCH domain-containing protein 18-like isoform X1 [Ipomoea batatas]